MAEGDAIVFLMLALIPLGLTMAMFHTKSMMLGFPCVIFWAILSGYAYGESTATWDWQYLLFFGSMGMVIFSAIAMYGLREKRDAIGDKSMEHETGYIDETTGKYVSVRKKTKDDSSSQNTDEEKRWKSIEKDFSLGPDE